MTAKLTPKGAATRDRIIQGASAEIRENGVTSTLDDIRVRTGTSKSQLFHYFPDGREQLLLAVARYEADRVLADQQPQLGDLTSWASWRAWREAVVARYREQGQQCPLSALTTQLGRATPGAQAVVSELMGQWQAEIATSAIPSGGIGWCHRRAGGGGAGDACGDPRAVHHRVDDLGDHLGADPGGRVVGGVPGRGA